MDGCSVVRRGCPRRGFDRFWRVVFACSVGGAAGLGVGGGGWAWLVVISRRARGVAQGGGARPAGSPIEGLSYGFAGEFAARRHGRRRRKTPGGGMDAAFPRRPWMAGAEKPRSGPRSMPPAFMEGSAWSAAPRHGVARRSAPSGAKRAGPARRLRADGANAPVRRIRGRPSVVAAIWAANAIDGAAGVSGYG